MEEKVTGGGDVEVDELTVLLQEINTDMESCQSLIKDKNQNEKAKEETDKEKREKARNAAMESFSETSKRKGDDTLKSPTGKMRRSASDTLSFLAERTRK